MFTYCVICWSFGSLAIPLMASRAYYEAKPHERGTDPWRGALVGVCACVISPVILPILFVWASLHFPMQWFCQKMVGVWATIDKIYSALKEKKDA